MSPFHPYPYPSYLSNYPAPYHGGPSQAGSSVPPHINNISFPNNPPRTQNQPNQSGRERVKIDPMPISYSELYDTLLKENLIAPEVPRFVSNPPPKWYNANEACKYHMGELGHSIERCISFKICVQKLTDAGKLVFKEEPGQLAGASVDNNPLPKH
ncbi:hypothetical protein SESBI_05877 [Sesbania bispinosa]|nr:hypothetical protein SESBI_05877 [Sesbania bispinosa]